MSKSENIGQLAEALAKAQAEIRHAVKEADNPFFKSKYADLAAVWDAAREPLSKNKLSIAQVVEFDEAGPWLETLLLHASGEWLSSRYPISMGDGKPQTMGSATTYARRYALSAMVGIASEDDDGNSASGRGDTKPIQRGGYDDLLPKSKAPPPKKKDPGASDLDVDPPPSVRSLPNDLATFYGPFNQYAGISFAEMPDKALKHIGDHILPMSTKETKATRKKWFDAIKEGLMNEIADRVLVKPEEIKQ